MGTGFADVREGNTALADVDGDGDVDVLLHGETEAEGFVTELYLNDGAGRFAEADAGFPEGVRDADVAFSDVDGDGDADALIAGFIPGLPNGAGLYLNDGRGAFALQTFNRIKEPFSASVAFADLDGDRDDDLIIGGTDWPQAAAVYRNDGRGRFASYPQVGYTGISFNAIAVGDLDGDGDNDAVFTGSDGASSAELSRLYFNDGAADFTPAFPQPFRDMHLGGIALSDVDGDGDLDAILTGNARDGNAADPVTLLYLNDGAGGFAEAPEQPFPPLYLSEVIAADLDGDGDEDIILSGSPTFDNTYIPVTRVYRNDSPVSSTRAATRAAPTTLELYPNPVSGAGVLSVELPAGASATAPAVLTDPSGRRVGRYPIDGGPAAARTIELGHLPRGVYTVRIGAAAGSCRRDGVGGGTTAAPAFALHLRGHAHLPRQARHRLRSRGLPPQASRHRAPREARRRGRRRRHARGRFRRLPRLRPPRGRGHRIRRIPPRDRGLRHGPGRVHDGQQAPIHPLRVVLGTRDRRARPASTTTPTSSSLAERFTTTAEGLAIVDAFFSAEFEGGRHARRIGKIPCS